MLIILFDNRNNDIKSGAVQVFSSSCRNFPGRRQMEGRVHCTVCENLLYLLLVYAYAYNSLTRSGSRVNPEVSRSNRVFLTVSSRWNWYGFRFEPVSPVGMLWRFYGLLYFVCNLGFFEISLTTLSLNFICQDYKLTTAKGRNPFQDCCWLLKLIRDR